MPLLLALLGAALAHVPHDVAAFVAVPPNPEPTWVVSSLWTPEGWLAVRTPNGQDLEAFYVMGGAVPDVDGAPVELRGGEMLDGETLFVGTTGKGLWQSTDAGRSWLNHPDVPLDAVIRQVVSSPDVFTDGTAFAVGFGGVWRTVDRGATWQLVADLRGTLLVALACSPDFAVDRRVCALTYDGRPICSADGGDTWEIQVGVPGDGRSIALGPGAGTWVGLGARGLWRARDGLTWEPAGFDGEDVTNLLSLGDGVLLATTATAAAWRTQDDGETWSLRSGRLEPPSTEDGPADGNHYYELQRAENGVIWLASWEGLASSADDGLTWTMVETASPDTVMDLAVATGTDATNPLVLMAAYGGGLATAEAHLTQATFVGHGLSWLYPEAAAFSDTWLGDGVAMVAGGGDLFVTRDAGSTWEAAGGALTHPNVAVPSSGNPSAPMWYTAGGNGEVGEFATSPDAGRSFAQGTLEPACAGAGTAVAVAPGGGAAWAACGDAGRLYVSRDQGLTWDALGEARFPVSALAGVGDDTVFLATEQGVYQSVADGAPTLLALALEPVRDVAASPAWDTHPYVYAVTSRAGWYRSMDGGTSWDALAAPTDQVTLAVALSPDFGTDGVVVAGGYGGAWVSYDRGETWGRQLLLQAFQESQPAFQATAGEWTSVADDAASAGAWLSSASAGSTLTFTFRGVGVELVAPRGPDLGTLAASVDGQAPTMITLTADAGSWREVVWVQGNLSDAWHRLTLTVDAGTAGVDAAYVWRAPLTSDPEPPDTAETADPDTDGPSDTGTGADDKGCGGCGDDGGGGSATILGLAGLGLGWRRRRRGAVAG